MSARVRAWLVLGVASVIAMLAAHRLVDFGALRLRFDVDATMQALMPASGALRAGYDRARREFPDDDLLYVAWLTEDLFTPPRLAALADVSRRLAALPDVVSVTSLATVDDLRATGTETTIAPFLREIPPDTSALRSRALTHPLVRGTLVAEDGRGALLAIAFTPGLATNTLVERIAQVRALATPALDGIETIVSGPLYVRVELSRMLYRITPLAIVFTFIVAVWAFRSLRGLVLPILANLGAALVVLALFVGGGHALNFVTVSLPPVVYVVGYAYAIHVVAEYERLFVSGVARADAARRACRAVAVPVTLAALTTALAFVTLMLSGIDSIRLFGLYAALGAVIAWAAAFTIVPAGLVLLPGKPSRHAGGERTHGVARWLAARLESNRRAIKWTAALAAAAALAGATRVTVDTAVLSNFRAGNPTADEFRRINDRFAGAVPLKILVEARAPDAFKEPTALRAIADLDAWLEAQPDIGGAYSLADQVSVLQRAFAPHDPAALPASARTVHQLFALSPPASYAPFVNPLFDTSMVHVASRALSTAAVNRLSARISARLRELPPELSAQVTGTSAVIARTVDDITRAQIVSVVTALVLMGAVLALLFRSWRVGLISLVPNVLPIVLYFGLLGVLPLTLNLTTSLVACAVFGIAIDDTVVFLSRYAIERARDASQAIEATLSGIVRPATITSAALCAGFLALSAGELRAQAEFGLLAALTLGFAWLIDVTLTPVLCRQLDVKPVRAGRDSA